MCKVETDSAMGVKVLGLNVRIGGRDVMITIEEARILEGNLHEALHGPIDTIPTGELTVPVEEFRIRIPVPVEEFRIRIPVPVYPSYSPYSPYYWDSHSTCMKGDIIS